LGKTATGVVAFRLSTTDSRGTLRQDTLRDQSSLGSGRGVCKATRDAFRTAPEDHLDTLIDLKSPVPKTIFRPGFTLDDTPGLCLLDGHLFELGIRGSIREQPLRDQDEGQFDIIG